MDELNENCIFCKIINKEIPCSFTYEDDKFIGFLDIKPKAPGHTLLIPKKHYEWMQETPDEVISEIFILTKSIMKKMIKETPCDYVQVNILGKDVPHFHIHLIPKFFSTLEL